jgi:hypothetical protein
MGPGWTAQCLVGTHDVREAVQGELLNVEEVPKRIKKGRGVDV